VNRVRQLALRILRLVALTLCCALASLEARAAVQVLEFPDAPAWYFFSLQVRPDDADPLDVLPVGGGFEYEHLWSFDAQAGWRHFAPPSGEVPPGIRNQLNDLGALEPLRGYWIRVTRVPSPDFTLTVSGDPVLFQQLSGAGWHAVGPLLSPNAPPASVGEVFRDSPDPEAQLAETWSFDRSAGRFTEIQSYSASCETVPSQCLAPGSGYWVRTTGDVTIGKEFRITPDAVLLSADAPFQRLDISYTGGSLSGASGLLRTAAAGTGLRFVPAKTIVVDDVPALEPDLSGGSTTGPVGDRDLDGDGSPDCSENCAGAPDCVSLCFANSTDVHSVFVTLDVDALTALEEFTTLDRPGGEFALLELGIDSETGGGSAPDNVVSTIPVAVKPPAVEGEYAGFLLYEGAAPVPLRAVLGDCPPGASCSTLGAVINPAIAGSRSNGLDDDGDGDVDEEDEDGTIRVRETPGFPSEVVLVGSISPDHRLLSLRGEMDGLPDLGFAAGAADAGIRVAFADASRQLVLEGRRSGIERFSGTFVDRYDEVALSASPADNPGGGAWVAGQSSVIGRGRFHLERVTGGQCVAHDAGGTRAQLLDVPCREDADCPWRCTGDADREGFACSSDADCGSGSCDPFRCESRQLTGASERMLDYAELLVSLDVNLVSTPAGAGEFSLASVEVVGLPGVAALVTDAGAAVDLGSIPCGEYAVRVTSANCSGESLPFDVCDPGANPGPIAVTCAGPASSGDARPPVLASGSISIVGGFASTGPADVQPKCVKTGECAAYYEAPDGSPIEVVLADDSGQVTLDGVAGQPAVAGRDPLSGWTELLEWPPVHALRAGLLPLLDEPQDPNP
jgi:hypothetical protein